MVKCNAAINAKNVSAKGIAMQFLVSRKVAKIQIGLNPRAGLVLAIALGLSACAETESGGTANIISDISTLSSGSSQSSEQKQLSQVQRDYARARVTGAAAGGLLAGVGTAIAGGNSTQIAAATAVGATAGYLGASALTKQNADFQLSRDTLQQDIESARQENARMAKSVTAAENVVRYQRSEIARLNTGYRQGSVSVAEYKSKYATMQRDLKTTQTLTDESEKRLNSLNQSIRAYQQAGIGTSQLSAERNKQQARVNRLKGAEAQIVRNLSNVPDAVS